MARRQYFRYAQGHPRMNDPAPAPRTASNPRKPASWEPPSHCPLCLYDEGDYVSDHCHRTGIRRDWLCRKCNAGLGMFRDNPAILERAIAYLRHHNSRADDGTAEQWIKGQYHAAHPRA